MALTLTIPLVVVISLLTSTVALSNQPISRRNCAFLVTTTGWCWITKSLTIDVEDANAASVDNNAVFIENSIRKAASNIPGYGPLDVFYPKLLRGKWNATEEFMTWRTDDSNKNQTLHYEMRFIPSSIARTQGKEEEFVIADRGFNQVARTNAAVTEDEPGKLVRSYEWKESNPNVLRLTFQNGSGQEIKVTKRASKLTEDYVSTSEFRRITVDENLAITSTAPNAVPLAFPQSVPIITAQQVLTKWKVISNTHVEGFELVYDMGGGGDPLGSGTLQDLSSPLSSKPILLSKSRLHLSRIYP